jgi:branched-chain amino acid transport system permease protein
VADFDASFHPASTDASSPVPQMIRSTLSSRLGSTVAVALVGLMVAVALSDSKAWQGKLTEVAVFVSLASLWNLLAGYAGLVSVGQQAFFGLGCYGLIVFANGFGLPIYVAVLPAALAAGLLAVPIGALAFRLRGPYFAIGMWVIAEVVRLVVKNNTSKTIGGGRGTTLKVPAGARADRLQNTALLAIITMVVVLLACWLLLRSRYGLGLQAARDNESGARGLGADVWRIRFAVFVVAGALTALVGAVFQLKALNVQPDAAFSVGSWTAPIVVMVVIGGLGTIEGPVIGAVFYYFVQDLLTSKDKWYSISPVMFQIVMGALALACALLLRGGLWGTLAHRFPGLQLSSLQRRLVLPTTGATNA